MKQYLRETDRQFAQKIADKDTGVTAPGLGWFGDTVSVSDDDIVSPCFVEIQLINDYIPDASNRLQILYFLPNDGVHIRYAWFKADEGNTKLKQYLNSFAWNWVNIDIRLYHHSRRIVGDTIQLLPLRVS